MSAEKIINKEKAYKIAAQWVSRDETIALGILGDSARSNKTNLKEFLITALEIVLTHSKNSDISLEKIILMSLQLGDTWDGIITAFEEIFDERDYLKKHVPSIAKAIHNISGQNKTLNLLLQAMPSGLIIKEYKSMISNDTKQEKTILIMTIRKEEIQSILYVFGGYCQDAGVKLEYNTQQGFYSGFYKKANGELIQIMIAQSRDTGNTMSSSETSHFISKCSHVFKQKPLFAMLVGICAATRKRHAVLGDIVIPQNIFDDSIRQIKKDGEDFFDLPEIRNPGIPHPGLIRMCKHIDRSIDWKKIITLPEGITTYPGVHFDPLLTRNDFLEDDGLYMDNAQKTINRKSLAYEMEAAGFAHGCNTETVPFVVVRGISDFADKQTVDGRDLLRPYAANVAAIFSLEIAKEGILPD